MLAVKHLFGILDLSKFFPQVRDGRLAEGGKAMTFFVVVRYRLHLALFHAHRILLTSCGMNTPSLRTTMRAV